MHRSDGCRDVKKHIIVFFTFGVSLKTWDEVGILSREVALYAKLIDLGCKITFVTYGDQDDLKLIPKNMPIQVKPIYQFYNRPKSKILQVITSMIFLRHMDFRDIDIIKTNQFWGSWLALYAKILFKKPLLLRMGFEYNQFALQQGRSPIFRAAVSKLSKLIYSKSDLIQVSSEEDKKYLAKHFELKEHKIKVRKNYIDTELFSPKAVEKERDVLVVGRLEKQKNINTVLEAMAGLPLTLTLVGSGSLRSAIRSLAVALNVDIEMLPKIDNDRLPDLINSHRVFVLASHYEGNPKVLLEAMSCGALVFANESDGISSIVAEEINGRFFHNSEELRSLLLKSDEDKAVMEKKYGSMARTMMLEQNSLDVIVTEELDTYDKLSAIFPVETGVAISQ